MKGSSGNEPGFTPQWPNLVAEEKEWVLECDVPTRGRTHHGFSSEDKKLELTLSPLGDNNLYSLKNTTKSSSTNLLSLGNNSSPRNKNQWAGSSSKNRMLGLQCSDKHRAMPHTSHKRQLHKC